MADNKLTDVVNTIKEKLGDENSAKIGDSLAQILTIERANEETLKDKEKTITNLKNDKELLIQANGNLLLQVPQGKEEDNSFFENNSRKQDKQPFDFRSIFDEKGKFKR